MEDGDGEEEVVPVQFVGIDGQKDDGKKGCAGSFALVFFVPTLGT